MNLKENNSVLNILAFSYLLEYGRINILDDEFFNLIIEKTNKCNTNQLMTPKLIKEVLKTSRYMAEMNEEDLNNYIYKSIKNNKNIRRKK